ncbi:hypothetical protein HAX54_026958, partial [Datura stramonium]|nr:hypothetical protein [Datura stramonium]
KIKETTSLLRSGRKLVKAADILSGQWRSNIERGGVLLGFGERRGAGRSRQRREKERSKGRKVGDWMVSGWLLAGVRGGKMGRGEEDDVGSSEKTMGKVKRGRCGNERRRRRLVW